MGWKSKSNESKNASDIQYDLTAQEKNAFDRMNFVCIQLKKYHDDLPCQKYRHASQKELPDNFFQHYDYNVV